MSKEADAELVRNIIDCKQKGLTNRATGAKLNVPVGRVDAVVKILIKEGIVTRAPSKGARARLQGYVQQNKDELRRYAKSR